MAKITQSSIAKPLDESGVRHYYAAIPDHLRNLVDDRYRSLAGYVRNARRFDKTPTGFAKFIWADFFRRCVPVALVRSDCAAAVQMAVPFAYGHHANGMPGYRNK